MKCLKVLTSWMLSLTLAFGMLFGSMTMNVVKASQGGEIEDDITWELDDTGVLTIDGEGALYNASPWDMPWIKEELQDDIKKIVIKDGITSLPRGLFNGFLNLTTVEIGDGLEQSFELFDDNHSLTTVKIGKGLAAISDFFDCENLTNLTIDPNNPYLKAENSIIYSKDGTEMYYYPLSKTATSYTVSDTVTVINSGVFLGNKSLKEITLSNNLKTIYYRAFKYCSNLETITMPSSVTKIDQEVFASCYSLQDVYYNGTIEQWEAIEIRNGNEYLTEATIHCNDGDINGVVVASDIKLNKSSVSVDKGKTTKLTATITPSDAEDKTVTWSSSDETVATVKDGTVTGKGLGTATITATTSNGLTATCEVTVKGISMTSVSLYKKVQTATLSTFGLTGKITYKSSKKSVATVGSTSGKITAKKKGTAYIYVYIKGKKSSYKCKVTVKNCSIKVNKTKATVKKGNTYQIVATPTPAGTLSFKSSKTSVASVDKATGLVTAKKKGKATITVKANGVSKKVTITVKN